MCEFRHWNITAECASQKYRYRSFIWEPRIERKITNSSIEISCKDFKKQNYAFTLSGSMKICNNIVQIYRHCQNKCIGVGVFYTCHFEQVEAEHWSLLQTIKLEFWCLKLNHHNEGDFLQLSLIYPKIKTEDKSGNN